MPAEPGARPSTVLATMRVSLASMRGTTRTRTARRTRWARRSRTPGGCTTCTGTYGSGAQDWYDGGTMRSRRRTIRLGLQRARTAWIAAVAGASRRGTAGRRAAATRARVPRAILGFRVAQVPAAGPASPASGAEHRWPEPRATGGSTGTERLLEQPAATQPTIVRSGPEPAPAIAPFDAEQAKRHQEAWAKHLGLPVELTNSIGMKLVLIPPGEFMMGARIGGRIGTGFRGRRTMVSS